MPGKCGEKTCKAGIHRYRTHPSPQAGCLLRDRLVPADLMAESTGSGVQAYEQDSRSSHVLPEQSSYPSPEQYPVRNMVSRLAHREREKTGSLARSGRDCLLHRYCFGRALVDAGLAIYAEVGVDLCFAVHHADGGSRADIHTGLTGGTLLDINNCWHFVSSKRMLRIC